MTNFVFGMLIALFVFAAIVLVAVIYLDGQLSESGILIPPLV
ncbi:MAG TPA: hypothetical protein VJU14_04995 [Solirubrobacterales bacterium]|nr:hypothetical protein [Solirubrobacterales bacterium]